MLYTKKLNVCFFNCDTHINQTRVTLNYKYSQEAHSYHLLPVVDLLKINVSEHIDKRY